MKTTYTLLFAVLIIVFGYAQAPPIDWQKTLGGNSRDDLYSINPTSDGGFIIGGTSASGISGDKTMDCQGNNGTSDCWIIKTSAIGTIEWQKSIGGDSAERYAQIFQTTDGGYIIGCSSWSNISGDKTENSFGEIDYWVVKLDALGNVLWDKTLGGNDYDTFESIIQTPDGGYLIGGTSISNASGNKTENYVGYIPIITSPVDDYWIVKLDAFGNIEWENTIGGDDADDLSQLINTPDGGYLVGGRSFSPVSGDKAEPARSFQKFDFWILKLDTLGNILWQRTIGGTEFDACYTVLNTIDGGYLIGGISNSNISGEKTDNAILDINGFTTSDFWVLKLDVSGNILWQKTIGGTGNDFVYEIIQDTNGNFLLAGFSDSNISYDKTENSRGGLDFWLVKINSIGVILWDKTLGGAQNETLYGACYVANDNSFALGGPSLSSNTGDKTEVSRGLNDYWIVKLQPESLSTNNFDSANVQVYPNPTIKTVYFDFSETQNLLKIKIINVIGQIITETVLLNSSKIDVDINGKPGIYFIEIENDRNQKQVFKIVKR